MTAEEYLAHLVQVAHQGAVVTVHQLEILAKLLKEGKTGVYQP